jgi:hypothetical protein
MTTQLIEQQNSLFVPLTDFAISEAEEMARCHQSIAKRKDVFDKSVALAGLADWLTYDLGLTADVAMGDFYDPLLRDCHDVADLIVQEMLKIECCIVEDGATDFMISPDVYPEMDSSSNAPRIAYVVVRLPDDLVELEILGFLPAVELASRDLTKPISLSELYASEDLAFEIRAAAFDLDDFGHLEGLVKSDIDDQMMISMICGNLQESSVMRELALKNKKDQQSEELVDSPPEPIDVMEQEQQEKMARVILRRLKLLWQD